MCKETYVHRFLHCKVWGNSPQAKPKAHPGSIIVWEAELMLPHCCVKSHRCNSFPLRGIEKKRDMMQKINCRKEDTYVCKFIQI